MSIPYPKTASKPRSQTEDHLAGLASRYIEQRLDDGTGWDEVLEHVKRAHGKTHEQAARGVLLAMLDLEWSGAMTFDGVTDRYRRTRPGDPEKGAAR